MALYNDILDNNDLENRQEKIPFSEKYSFAIIIGCGGTGSWVGLNLALCGRIENLVLIDPDIIEQSNLNRTPYRLCDVGKNKAEALKYIILERRLIDIYSHPIQTNKDFSIALLRDIKQKSIDDFDESTMEDDVVIIDCRDDIYDDFYNWNCKYYKLGYDGCSITLDGNPQNTPVWGSTTGYQVTPSFLCPPQLLANLVVNDICIDITNNADEKYKDYYCDEAGRLNDVITIDTQYLMRKLYFLSKKEN